MEQHIDDEGKIWDYRYSTPAETDIDAQLLLNVSVMEKRILEGERGLIEIAVASGNDPFKYRRKYLSPSQSNKHVVRIFMQSLESRQALPVAEWLSTNVSANQLSNMFGANRAAKITNRINSLIGNKLFIRADATEVKI